MVEKGYKKETQKEAQKEAQKGGAKKGTQNLGTLMNFYFYERTNPRQYLCKPSRAYPVHRQEPARMKRTALCMSQHPM